MKEVNFLLVDDSPIVKNIVKKVLLSLVGAKAVYGADTHAEALEILSNKKVDVILCNWDDPDMSKNKLLFETRRNKEWKKIPFIIMTTVETREFLVSALSLGAAQCLVRPITVQELEDAVRKSWNAASKRQVHRFSSLPGHALAMKATSRQMDAKLLNISNRGCLIRAPYTDDLRLFGGYELVVDFEATEHGVKFSTTRLIGTVIRLEKDSSDSDPSKKICQMGVYFDPRDLDEKTEKTINDLIGWLETLNPERIITK